MIQAIALYLCLSSPSVATASDNPCKALHAACADAGFVKGKHGAGLWRDCIIPLMTDKPQPANAKIKLPTIDPKVLAECKAKHGTHGEHTTSDSEPK